MLCGLGVNRRAAPQHQHVSDRAGRGKGVSRGRGSGNGPGRGSRQVPDAVSDLEVDHNLELTSSEDTDDTGNYHEDDEGDLIDAVDDLAEPGPSNLKRRRTTTAAEGESKASQPNPIPAPPPPPLGSSQQHRSQSIRGAHREWRGGPPSSMWSETTVWVGNVAIVRREDTPVRNLVILLVAYCLLSSNTNNINRLTLTLTLTHR